MSNTQPPLPGQTGSVFDIPGIDTGNLPGVTTLGDSQHQMLIAWHELEHTLKRKNVRQQNRVRIYGSQLAGAVK